MLRVFPWKAASVHAKMSVQGFTPAPEQKAISSLVVQKQKMLVSLMMVTVKNEQTAKACLFIFEGWRALMVNFKLLSIRKCYLTLMLLLSML
jgi:hypothetical protein